MGEDVKDRVDDWREAHGVVECGVIECVMEGRELREGIEREWSEGMKWSEVGEWSEEEQM